MHNNFRSCFATVCLIAVAACDENKTADFDLEKVLLNRAADHQSNDMYVQPDNIPNWMRGFYDDFPT